MSNPAVVRVRDRRVYHISDRYLLPAIVAGILAIAICVVVGRADTYAAQVMVYSSMGFCGLTVFSFGFSIYVWNFCSDPMRRQAFPLLTLAIVVPLAACVLLELTGVNVGLVGTENIVVGSGFVRIEGRTSFTLADRLRSLLDPSLNLERVELANSGGSVDNAIQAADYLQARGVHTAVATGDCASACAYMLLLFPKRYAEPSARLGFHDLANEDPAELIRQRAQLKDRLIKNGIPAAMVDQFFSTVFIRWVPSGDLEQQGLTNSCWNPDEKQPTPCTVDRP